MTAGVLSGQRDFTAGNRQIAEMLLRAVRSGDVPTTPAVFERSSMAEVVAAPREDGRLAFFDEQRSQQVTWHALRPRRLVTLQTPIGLTSVDGNLRSWSSVLEHSSKFGIRHGDLQHLFGPAISDVEVVIEDEYRLIEASANA